MKVFSLSWGNFKVFMRNDLINIRNFNNDFSVNSASTAYRIAMHPIYQLLEAMEEKDQLNPVQKNLVLHMPEWSCMTFRMILLKS